MKKNSMALGIISGIIAPMIGLLCYWLFSFRQMTLSEFLTYFHRYKLVSAALSTCLVFNLAIFFLFLYLKWETSAKGVLISTFLYAIIVVLAKTNVI
jgi:hypothetical protein